MSDKRSSARRRTFKGGLIMYGTVAGIDCLLRNMSETGACLELTSTFAIPDQFSLIVRPEGLRRDCTVHWRTETHIGVSFSEPLSSAVSRAA